MKRFIPPLIHSFHYSNAQQHFQRNVAQLWCVCPFRFALFRNDQHEKCAIIWTDIFFPQNILNGRTFEFISVALPSNPCQYAIIYEGHNWVHVLISSTLHFFFFFLRFSLCGSEWPGYLQGPVSYIYTLLNNKGMRDTQMGVILRLETSSFFFRTFLLLLPFAQTKRAPPPLL